MTVSLEALAKPRYIMLFCADNCLKMCVLVHITPACNLLNTSPKRKRGMPSLTLRAGEDLSHRRNK